MTRESGSMASSDEAELDESPRRLDAILRALPESELKGLITRMGIRIDAAKRIDAPSQAARALVGLPDVCRSDVLHDACTAVVSQFLELLINFVGEDLAMRLLQDLRMAP